MAVRRAGGGDQTCAMVPRNGYFQFRAVHVTSLWSPPSPTTTTSNRPLPSLPPSLERHPRDLDNILHICSERGPVAALRHREVIPHVHRQRNSHIVLPVDARTHARTHARTRAWKEGWRVSACTCTCTCSGEHVGFGLGGAGLGRGAKGITGAGKAIPFFALYPISTTAAPSLMNAMKPNAAPCGATTTSASENR